jgi:hypothetical protein
VTIWESRLLYVFGFCSIKNVASSLWPLQLEIEVEDPFLDARAGKYLYFLATADTVSFLFTSTVNVLFASIRECR